MTKNFVIALMLVGLRTVWAAPGPGEEFSDGPVERETPADSTRAAVAEGGLLPLSQSAALPSGRAYALGLGGYDSARATGTFETGTEMRLWGPVAIRGGALYTHGNHVVRPTLGLRVQALAERRHALDLAVGVAYRPEGLTEPEGEIEAMVGVGRHFGSTYVLGNLLYGQDPEGRERDAEVRVAAVRAFAQRLFLGVDGRLRASLGTAVMRAEGRQEARRDAYLGPVITCLAGPVAMMLEGGGAALEMAGTTSYGLFVVGGAGTAF